ncbi:MAG TPA: PAS domain S-box protein [Ignavibacteriaceae bacterium]|nr:PAS domain S-box protein [Ignavibacteriaceae bacterium]
MQSDRVKARILIVEDESIVAFDLSSRLEAMGFKVIGIASNGVTAIEIAKKELPDMVLMDIMLGGEIDGIETTKKINESNFIPVIYLTAYSDPGTLERAKLSEPFGYILKPFEEQELRSTIEMALYKYTIEKKLKESEERYRIIAEQTGQLVYDFNITTGEIVVSGAIFNLTGHELPKEQTLNISVWEENIHPEDKERVLAANQKSIDSLKPLNITYRLRRKDGTYVFVEEKGVVISKNGGKELKMLGTINNITEKKLIEEERRLNENRIEALLHLHNMSVEPISQFTSYALEQGINLTKSKIGFLAFVNEEETEMVIYAFSEGIFKKSQLEKLPWTIKIQGGVLGAAIKDRKPVVLNNYQTESEGKRGYPDWHVNIDRFLNIPIFDEDKIVLVAGVGNKVTDYNESDIKQLTLLMTEMYNIIKSKKAASDLKESEKKYRELTEWLPLTVYETDKTGKITYANKKAFQLFGYAENDLIEGKNLLEFMAPESQEKVVQNINRVFSAEQAVEPEYTAIKKDGTKLSILVNSLPIWKDGHIIGSRGAVTDLSYRKAAERALAISESRLRQIIDSVPQLIFAKDQSGKFILVNKAFSEFVNVPIEKIPGKYSDELFKELDNFNELLSEDHEVFTTGASRIFFNEITDINGVNHFFQVTKTPFIFHDDEVPSLLGVATDITEGKVYADTLRRLTKAIEQSPVSIVITDTNGSIEYVNPKFCHTFNYSVNEVIGKNPRILKSSRTSIETYRELWNTILSGNEWRGEMLNKKKDGSLIWESISISPIKNDEKKITHFVAVREDITLKKEMEEELRRAVNKAEESNRLKTSLIGNMSHEFRTPLVGILGFTQFLSDTVADPEQLSMLERITKSAKRLTNTLNGVLQFAQLEGNEIQADIQELMLDKYVKYMYRAFIPLAEEKNLKLEVKVLHENISVMVDERLLNLVINNIVDNAIKFTNKGGITIIVELEEQFDEKWGLVKIKDTGIGISDSDKSLIFKEFRQVSEGVSRRYEGTGLGLNISRRIMTLMGGSLTFTSVVNEGSEFSIKIPCSNNRLTNEVELEDEFDAINELIEKSNLTKETILLVEDNEINREVIIAYLTNTCKVEAAKNAEEAINLAQKKIYSAVLMDINLGGGMNGLEAADEIKRIPGYKNIPIIAVTGYTLTQDKNSFLQKGFAAHLSKPFDQNELVELINKVLK